jgi:hypothetical protein
MWHCIVWTGTNVSEEPAAAIFMVYTLKGTFNISFVTYDLYIAECNEGSDTFLRCLLLGIMYKWINKCIM